MDLIEKLARRMILNRGGDPDMLVQPGEPRIFATPSGPVFSVAAGAEVPMWRFYRSFSEEVLNTARALDQQAKIDTIADELRDLAIDQPRPANLAS